MARVDLIAHVGPACTGAPMVAGALSRLRPLLLRHNVAYVGPDDLDALPSVAGWAVNAQCDAADADRFAADLRELVERERREALAISGADRTPNVVVSSQRLLGRQPIGTADVPQFRPRALAAVEQLIAAVGAERTRVVLFSRRQDRLMERAYVAQVMDGRHHAFAEQFPHPEHPVLDFAELADRLRAVPGVVDVVVHTFELIRIAPETAVRTVLPARLRDLDLSPAGPLDLGRTYSKLGIQVALAMNRHVDSVDEHALVREFILTRFATSEVAGTRFLPKPARTAVLDAYAEANARLFRTYLPHLPPETYRDDAATGRLRAIRQRAARRGG